MLYPDDYSNDINTTGSFVVPNTIGDAISITASLETAYDNDWFKVDLMAEQRYSFSTDSTAEVYTAIYDASGSWLSGHTLGFTPTSSGVYYIEVGGYTPSEYTLTGRIYLDDYANNSSTTAYLPIDHTSINSIAGNIDTFNDSDWFAVNLVLGNSYNFSTTGNSSYNYPDIYDATGHWLTWAGMGFTPTRSGTYYVAVTGYNVGSYTLTGSLYRDDYIADMTTTGHLVTPVNTITSINGTLGTSDDTDWFAIDLIAAHSYIFSVVGAGSYTHPTLYDSSGHYLTGNGTITPAISGNYYVGVSGYNAGDYKLSAEQYLDDYADNSNTTASLLITPNADTPVLATGVIEVEQDSDWFALNLIAGNSYSMQTNQGYLLLFNAEAESSIVKANGAFSFTANNTGIYYLAESSYDKGHYSLSLSQYNDDYANNSYGAGQIDFTTMNGIASITGILEIPTDEDWFSMELSAGDIYRITAANTYLTVQDNTGLYLTTAYEATTFIAPNSARYYLTVANYYDESVETPNYYTVNALQIHDDYKGDNTTTAELLFNGDDMPVSLNGTIESSHDSDWFRVDLIAGKSYSFSLINGGINALLFSLNGSAGNTLMSDNYLRQISFTPTDSSTYYLSVSDEYQAIGNYTLSATQLSQLVLIGSDDNMVIDVIYGDTTVTGSYDILYGLAGENKLYSGGGDDTLYGGNDSDTLDGGTGSDIMLGEAGNDVYLIDSVDDTVIETSVISDEIDVVSSMVDYILGANLENLTLTGTAALNGVGNALKNNLLGNSGDNSLKGMAGNDKLTAGDGIDWLDGGTGKDTYGLTEKISVTDTVHIAAGDSMVKSYDLIKGFTLGIDKLDLDAGSIAADSDASDGINQNGIRSHSISNGMMLFDATNDHSAALNTDNLKLNAIIHYLQSNIDHLGETVAFIQHDNTYIFQNNGDSDTLVRLAGVSASSLDNTGLAANSVWLI